MMIGENGFEFEYECLTLHLPSYDKADLSEFKQIRKALEEEGKVSAVKKAVVAKAAAK